MHHAPNDIYIIAFFLNPEYRNIPIYKKPNPLVIPPLCIRQRDGVTTTSLKLPEDIIKRVGLSLQRILRNEYGDMYENPATKGTAQTVMARRNPLLAKIHPTDALKSLKEQLKSYEKGYEPFNKRFRSNESLYSWWEQVQKVLVLAMKIFAAVPVSMTDERTMSMITWLNSPRRNRQDIETLRDHIKIRHWHRTGPGAKDENIKHKPLLKWRDVESTLEKRDTSKLVDKSLPPAGRAAPRPRLETSAAKPGSGPQEDELVHADAEIDDGNGWLDDRRQLDPAAVGVERHMFTLGGRTDIDLSSSYLRDILSDTDMSQTPAETGNTSRRDHGSGSGITKPPPASTDWDSWE
ncbi:hypothetical protein BU15DRAFT_73917 [Melanogaster broomeanus]|nr:hypothetical protein BU15DRAFT_73917 [Melanogaster broomeanus]